jgi:dTDP-4-amino-4,6-dideoxygalactose transaminase
MLVTLQKLSKNSYKNMEKIKKIPFVDLYAQYLSIKDEIDKAINNVIKESAFIRGAYVDKFEEDFSALIGVNHCISCANGTDALYIAMKALDINYGDEVIVPAHSWISSSETVTQAGGKIVFCDTDIEKFTIDVSKIESKITPKTVGIIAVHLYGQPADLDEIIALAKKYNLWIIEDCAQAHLAKYKGRHVGTFGNASTFSFYPGKNLGAMGDAGAILTNDKLMAEKMAMYARHGGMKKGDHKMEGINSRMDGVQAAILSAKIPHLKKWTKRRQEIAKLYTEIFENNHSIKAPILAPYSEHVWHLYVIKHDRRDDLARYLNGNGVSTSINYPIALPFLPAYDRLMHSKIDFPNSHNNQQKILSLPIFAELKNDEIEFIGSLISKFS